MLGPIVAPSQVNKAMVSPLSIRNWGYPESPPMITKCQGLKMGLLDWTT